MTRFLSDQWDKKRAQKRGGGALHLPLPFDDAETRYAHEPADNVTPDQCFDRQWALTLLDAVLQKLRAEYEQDGKSELFAVLSPCLVGGRENQPYADLAGRLRMSEGSVKVTVHRLRKRYRDLLREEVAQTIADTEDVDEELRHLFAVLARG